MNKENETIDNSKPMAYDTVLGVVDSNGKDYSHLKKSAYYIDPTYECNQCGSTLVTELDDKDICHDCGLFILKLPLTACGMVSKATHTAIYNEQNLIGFINYYRLLALVFAGGINTKDMSYKKVFEKRDGNLIWFGESEETCDLTGIVIGYNDKGCILAVAHGNGDYELKPTDVVPNEADRNNPQGYLLNDLEYIEFDV